MKKILLIIVAVLMITNLSFAQKKESFPTGDAIITIEVPSGWDADNEENLLSVSPVGDSESDRLIVMVWASENPYADDAMDVITDEAFDLVETLLVDIEWGEETTEFESNGIEYAAIDGFGYYVNEDESRDYMSASIFLFMPDDTNLLTMVFFSTQDAYSFHEDALLEMILSIAPY
jgi:hypothetical protein